MPRPRSPNRDKAKEMYLKSKGNTKLIDIAEKLGLKPSQIRKWKSIDKWDDQLKGALPKTKSNVTKKEHKKPTRKEKEILEELEDAELTEKQRLFCLYYVKCWNAGKAAKKAGYECSYPNGFYEIGCQLRKKTQVKKEIDKLKQNIREGIGIEAMAVFQKYIDIAFADITDYVTFGQREVPVMTMFGPAKDGKGNIVTKEINYVDFKESSNIDGSIIKEVKQGKEGVSIKLADKMKALEKLEKYFDLIPDKWKRKIEEEKIALAKLKAGEDPEEDQTDDGFIEALQGKVKEVWADEK